MQKERTKLLQPTKRLNVWRVHETLLEKATGYIENPDATSDCAYCIYEVGDNYLTHISSKYSYLWRNFGIFWIYIFFNIIAMVCVYYLFHVRQSSFLSPVSILNKIKNIRKKKQ